MSEDTVEGATPEIPAQPPLPFPPEKPKEESILQKLEDKLADLEKKIESLVAKL